MAPTIKIAWDTLSINDWERRFAVLPYSNYIQSYSYARAASPHYKQKPRWGLILIDGKEAGLVQMFETGLLWNAIHAVMIDRGPLWLEGFGGALHTKLFFDEINRVYPARLGRKRRFLPEIEDGPTAQKLIAQTGLVRREDQTGYQTIWIDLTKDEEVLRAELRGNWRNALSKAERSDLIIEHSNDTLEWAAGIYAADKVARGYNGIPPALLKNYATILSPKNDVMISRAIKDGEPVAFIVTVTHGRSATYVVGWSSDAGREVSAHHLLLWHEMLRLKGKGIKELDLGGINEDGAAGIKAFKEGLGGRVVRYVGHYV